MPSDIEIRRNTYSPGLEGRLVVKNLFELKTAQRVLVEGNVFENNWADAQDGFAFVWWAAADNNPACITSDVTFRYNVVRNTTSGFNLAPGNGGTQPLRRVTIVHNLITGPEAQGGRMFQVIGSLDGITIANNTALGGGNALMLLRTANAPSALPTFVFRNNVTGGSQPLFVDGSGTNDPVAALSMFQVPAANVVGNVFAQTTMSYLVPPNNASTATYAAVGFADYPGGDLTLTSASPYRTAGVGGTTPGADMAALSTATSGVKLQ